MIALVCIDSATSTARRYVPQVIAGVRRAKCTHAFEILRPQQANLEWTLNQIRTKTHPQIDQLKEDLIA